MTYAAGSRRQNSAVSSLMRTHAQSRAELEPPRARGPYMPECKFSAATVLRTAAQALYQTRYPAAYGHRRSPTGALRPTANYDIAAALHPPGPSIVKRTLPFHFPPTLSVRRRRARRSRSCGSSLPLELRWDSIKRCAPRSECRRVPCSLGRARSPLPRMHRTTPDRHQPSLTDFTAPSPRPPEAEETSRACALGPGLNSILTLSKTLIDNARQLAQGTCANLSEITLIRGCARSDACERCPVWGRSIRRTYYPTLRSRPGEMHDDNTLQCTQANRHAMQCNRHHCGRILFLRW